MTDPVVAVVRREVAALDPVDARERDAQAATLAALERLGAPFDEAAGPTHLTGSGVVVGPRGVLLHRHKRLGLWLQPGGHVDPGETPWDAAVRETREETGVPAVHPEGGPRLVHVDHHPGGRGHVHLDLRYLLLAGDVEPRPGPGESPDVAWFDWAAAIGVADAGLVGALRRLQTFAPFATG